MDGELIVTDGCGHPDFEAVKSRFQRSNPQKIVFLTNVLSIEYCVFDLLVIGG